jgi:hypothetical protein
MLTSTECCRLRNVISKGKAELATIQAELTILIRIGHGRVSGPVRAKRRPGSAICAICSTLSDGSRCQFDSLKSGQDLSGSSLAGPRTILDRLKLLRHGFSRCIES